MEAVILTTKQLAERWGITERTLRLWRAVRYGPKWMKMGKAVRYRLEDVQRWEATRAEEFS
jgi:DNA-binding transcriptional MerR regulator